MSSCLDIHYGYDAGVIRTVYYYLDANTLVWCQHGIMAYEDAIVIVILYLCVNIFNYLFI